MHYRIFLDRSCIIVYEYTNNRCRNDTLKTVKRHLRLQLKKSNFLQQQKHKDCYETIRKSKSRC
jgi:hypothetical protein